MEEIDAIEQKVKESQEGRNTKKADVVADVQIPYDLACCYGIAYDIDVEVMKKRKYCTKVCELLARSLAASVYILNEDNKTVLDIEAIGNAATSSRDAIEDPNWYYWGRVNSDPDLESIRKAIDPEPWKKALRRKLLEEPSLLRESINVFEERIDELRRQRLKEPCEQIGIHGRHI